MIDTLTMSSKITSMINMENCARINQPSLKFSRRSINLCGIAVNEDNKILSNAEHPSDFCFSKNSTIRRYVTSLNENVIKDFEIFSVYNIPL